MTARAIGSATLSFGLVSVPVKLYSTAEPGRAIHFNLLHAGCGAKLRQQYWCPVHQRTVGRDEMVKGYAFARDRYVTFTDEELQAVSEQVTRAVEIESFLPAGEVDPIFFDTAYYLGPDKGGERAYRLLVEAMRDTGRAAVARYAVRGKQLLVMVRPLGDVLVMQQLRHAEEVKPVTEIPTGDAQPKASELELARQLIGQISAEHFEPGNYRDEVRERLQEAIRQKIEGKEIAAPPAEAPRTQVIDLMEALKASVEGRAAPPQQRAEAERPRRKPARRVGSSRAGPRRVEKKKASR